MVQLLHGCKACRMCAQESFLDEGFILDKRIGVGQPKRIENAKILVANTAMDTDKIKIYGARVRVDSMAKVVSQLNWAASPRKLVFHCLHNVSYILTAVLVVGRFSSKNCA